jgi:hypothetical protein
MQTATLNPPISLRFDQSKSQTAAVVADKPWWEDNQYRIGGLLRAVSRSAVIVSGLGVGTEKSPWRVAAGSMGLAAGVFLALFGQKQDDARTASTKSGPMPKEHIGRIYHGIIALSGAAMAISGMVSKSKRIEDSVAGLWSLGWSAYAALAPEDKPDAPVFDKGTTKAQPQGFVSREKEHALLKEYKQHPKKLASDMMQFASLFALVAGIKGEGGKSDPARIISAITMGASNYLQREMKDADFTPQLSGRLV